MKTANQDYAAKVRQIFDTAAFVSDVGIRLTAVAVGRCESGLAILPRHLQQDRLVHAGVLATMADHTAGAACGSLVGPDETVLSIEFKLNLLRPATGDRLHCKAAVLKPGRRICVVESEVFCEASKQPRLVAKATVTLAVVKEADLSG